MKPADFDPRKVLFFDIETVPLHFAVEEMQEDLQALFLEKKKPKKKKKAAKTTVTEDEDEAPVIENENFGGTGLHAEFGKVVCISVGEYKDGLADENFKIQSFASDNEPELLECFSDFLLLRPDYRLCAHNGKGFDLPFLCKRYLINQISIPAQLDALGKRPWEISLIDTMELWNFGSKGKGESLKTICAVFGIPSPKDDIDGSQVAGVYYNEKNLQRIVTYCEKDISVLAKVLKKIYCY